MSYGSVSALTSPSGPVMIVVLQPSATIDIIMP